MKAITKNEFMDIFPVFNNGPETLITEILSSCRYTSFPKDVVIYTEGDSCSAIAFVLSGEIRVFKTGANGREITLYEITRGETCILNASCILSHEPYPANALALKEGEILLIPADTFRGLISKYGEVRDFIFKLLSQRLASVMALIEEVAFGRMDERLLDHLKKEAENGEIHSTHQEIANDLGTSREVVSRLLKDFERQGNIVLSRSCIKLNN